MTIFISEKLDEEKTFFQNFKKFKEERLKISQEK